MSSCRIARRGATIDVEVPRDDPETVRLLPLCRQLDGEEVPAVIAVLELADDGAPLLIRLPSADVAHVLAAATQKPTFLATLMVLATLLARAHPQVASMGTRRGTAAVSAETVSLMPMNHGLGVGQ
jgi:S-DNA-T family DNA segregation ATPase FtsK/SpoIIIE